MIPKILHQIVGTKTNYVIDECLSSWHLLMPKKFVIKTWNDDLLGNFIANEYPFALQAFLNSRNHGEAADIARYLLIYHTGGFYMDWDVQLLDTSGFMKLIKRAPNGFLLIDPVNQTPAPEAFSAKKNESYLLNLVKEIVMLYECGKRNKLSTPYYSGPFRMRDTLKKFSTKQSLIPVKEVFVYDYSEIRIMPDRESGQPLIHYWLHSWL
jgi:hypothetical protein